MKKVNFLFLIILLLSSTFASAQVKNVKFVTTLNEKNALYQYTEEYLKLVFSKIQDYQFKISTIPSKDSEDIFFKDDSYVADFGRGADLKNKHPELLQIKYPFKTNTICLVKKESLLTKCDPKTLVKAKIGIQRGSLRVENFLKKNNLKQVIEFDNVAQGINELSNNAADIFLTAAREGESITEHDKPYRVIGTVDTAQANIYLKPQYADLAKEIQKQMADLAKDKTELTIYKRYFPEF